MSVVSIYDVTDQIESVGAQGLVDYWATNHDVDVPLDYAQDVVNACEFAIEDDMGPYWDQACHYLHSDGYSVENAESEVFGLSDSNNKKKIGFDFLLECWEVLTGCPADISVTHYDEAGKRRDMLKAKKRLQLEGGHEELIAEMERLGF